MSDATNVWDEVPDWGGVGARRLARTLGCSLGASIWEIQPRSSQFVIVSTNADPDVAEYPDTGKQAAIVGGEHRYHRVEDAVEHAGPE